MLIKLLLVILFSTLLNINEEKTRIIAKDINTNIKFKKPSLIEDIKKENNQDLLGTISIEKINLLNKPIYNIHSKKNNIEKNITILKESNISKENSIIFLAAHSGIGEYAYFKNLHKLNVKDTITIIIKNNEYKYIISNIYEQRKIGYIKVNKNHQNELILTTCSENENNQLIVESYLEK